MQGSIEDPDGREVVPGGRLAALGRHRPAAAAIIGLVRLGAALPRGGTACRDRLSSHHERSHTVRHLDTSCGHRLDRRPHPGLHRDLASLDQLIPGCRWAICRGDPGGAAGPERGTGGVDRAAAARGYHRRTRIAAELEVRRYDPAGNPVRPGRALTRSGRTAGQLWDATRVRQHKSDYSGRFIVWR